ncbi:MAG: Lrp/AsnC family transcriptional regulator [Candidatus Krumholzibacteriia bacterium]
MDAIDRRILTTLQASGRTTNVELARQNELAPSSMLDRVRRLEERGVIRGYRAELDPEQLGYHVAAMVMINLDRHQTRGIDTFEAGVAAIPEVKACFHVTGRYDYILHLAARDIDHLSELVKHRLGALGGVEKQETFLVLSTVKEDHGYSLEPLDPDHQAR